MGELAAARADKFDHRFGTLKMSIRKLRHRPYIIVEPAEHCFPQQDLVKFQHFLIHSPCVRVDVGTIWDLRRHDFDYADFTKVCAIVAASKLDARKHAERAFLVSSDVGFGMSRMFQQMADSRDIIQEHRISITKSARDAITWVTGVQDCPLRLWDRIREGRTGDWPIPSIR